MKITTKDDIAAPIAFVFEQVTDFGGFERQALRRGANVKRIDSLPKPGVGSAWDLTFPYRGKERDLRVDVMSLDAPDRITFKAKSGGLDSQTLIELVALSRTQTRLTVTVELLPTNLTSRLLVQSLKLAKGSVMTRLQGRLTGFANDVQGRYRRKQKA
jgi:hypothetical protein